MCGEGLARVARARRTRYADPGPSTHCAREPCGNRNRSHGARCARALGRAAAVCGHRVRARRRTDDPPRRRRRERRREIVRTRGVRRRQRPLHSRAEPAVGGRSHGPGGRAPASHRPPAGARQRASGRAAGAWRRGRPRQRAHARREPRCRLANPPAGAHERAFGRCRRARRHHPARTARSGRERAHRRHAFSSRARNGRAGR